jgi:eukaryotic translation initiation factor 2-alpha kinase 4
MYSLGVIFFEMSYRPIQGMERSLVLEKVRKSQPELPSDFHPTREHHTEIILSLLNHDPEKRPSSSEILGSGKMPLQMETESMRRMLDKMTDPNGPYFEKTLAKMFDRQNEPTKDYTWDLNPSGLSYIDPLRRHLVKDKLVSIFRRHGAEEGWRPCIFPKSSHYEGNVVQLLDRKGTVHQLPWDLMMGHARILAKVNSENIPIPRRSYIFGNVFRDRSNGGLPYMLEEVDFDIVTTDALDLALKEAEVIKVLDEVIRAFASTSSVPVYFLLGHSDLLHLIFEYCGVNSASRTATAAILSNFLGTDFDWQSARTQLRSKGVSSASINELQKFDFRGEILQ